MRKIIKLDYFTLLNPSPVVIDNVGSIISPTLRDIYNINNNLNSYSYYYTFISILLMDKSYYFENIEKNKDVYFANYSDDEKQYILTFKEEYDKLSFEEKSQIPFFLIIVIDKMIRQTVLDALNFFFVEKVEYDEQNHIFLLYKDQAVISEDNSNEDEKEKVNIPSGIITADIYSDVTDIILQRVNQNKKDDDKPIKIKNKIAEKLYNKIKKEKEKRKKTFDKKLEIGNIISSLAARSNNLNINNIWDLTIYQLYDQFNRQRVNESFDMQCHSVSVWGDSSKKFDGTLWFSRLDEDHGE